MVVDDEASTRDMVGDYLRMHGFRSTLCDGGASLREAFAKEEPDLIVLDLNMPEEDGLSIVRDLKAALDRAGDHADRDRERDRPRRRARARRRRLHRQALRAARAGRAHPLGAPPRAGPRKRPRPKTRMRRTRWCASAPSGSTSTPALLRDDDGVEHPLTASEFSLLKAFAEHPKRVLTRERLLDLANARDPDAFDRAIDIRITRIRRKIEPDPAHPSVIRTVRGAGYVFSPDGKGA